jgi:hypothetical protein
MKRLRLYHYLQIFALCLVGTLIGTAFVQPAFARECSDAQYAECNFPRCSACSSTSDCIQGCTDRCDDGDGTGPITCEISTCGDAGQCKNDAPCGEFWRKSANCGQTCMTQAGSSLCVQRVVAAAYRLAMRFTSLPCLGSDNCSYWTTTIKCSGNAPSFSLRPSIS